MLNDSYNNCLFWFWLIIFILSLNLIFICIIIGNDNNLKTVTLYCLGFGFGGVILSVTVCCYYKPLYSLIFSNNQNEQTVLPIMREPIMICDTNYDNNNSQMISTVYIEELLESSEESPQELPIALPIV